jgi:iron complex transport system substrate-binding protein
MGQLHKKFFFIIAFLFFFKTFIYASVITDNQNSKIISTAPAITEIIYLLEAHDYLVAVSNDCNYPKEALELPNIGSFLRPDIEKIIQFSAGSKPLLIGMGNPNSPKATLLESLGIKTIIFETPKDFEDIYMIILKLGEITNKTEKAKYIIQNLKDELVLISSGISKDRPSVLFIVWNPPLICAGNISFINSSIEAAGGTNILNKKKFSYQNTNVEYIIQQNPDIIVLSENKLYDSIMQHPGLKLLSAVKNRRIIFCRNPDILLRPGPRFIEGVKFLKGEFQDATNISAL